MEVYYQYNGEGLQKPVGKLQAELQCGRLRALIERVDSKRSSQLRQSVATDCPVGYNPLSCKGGVK